jgi:hypothetical protein
LILRVLHTTDICFIFRFRNDNRFTASILFGFTAWHLKIRVPLGFHLATRKCGGNACAHVGPAIDDHPALITNSHVSVDTPRRVVSGLPKCQFGFADQYFGEGYELFTFATAMSELERAVERIQGHSWPFLLLNVFFPARAGDPQNCKSPRFEHQRSWARAFRFPS